jgi:hypothetical protein
MLVSVARITDTPDGVTAPQPGRDSYAAARSALRATAWLGSRRSQ